MNSLAIFAWREWWWCGGWHRMHRYQMTQNEPHDSHTNLDLRFLYMLHTLFLWPDKNKPFTQFSNFLFRKRQIILHCNHYIKELISQLINLVKGMDKHAGYNFLADKYWNIFLIFSIKRFWHLKQIVSSGDKQTVSNWNNLHELSNPVFCEN